MTTDTPETRETRASITVKVSPFGPTFKGVCHYSNDPDGTWIFSVIKVTRRTPRKTVVFEVHGEKITGKGTGAKMDVLEVKDLYGDELYRESMKLMRQRADVVGGYMKDGKIQLDVVEVTGGFII